MVTLVGSVDAYGQESLWHRCASLSVESNRFAGEVSDAHPRVPFPVPVTTLRSGWRVALDGQPF